MVCMVRIFWIWSEKWGSALSTNEVTTNFHYSQFRSFASQRRWFYVDFAVYTRDIPLLGSRLNFQFHSSAVLICFLFMFCFGDVECLDYDVCSSVHGRILKPTTRHQWWLCWVGGSCASLDSRRSCFSSFGMAQSARPNIYRNSCSTTITSSSPN